jgi:aminoglycoside 3-N-acetyltransferase
LGVRPGSTLLVHSSLSSLGFVVGGMDAVIGALRGAIGPDGTLVLPTHSWERAGRGDFTFDLATTPSCVGAISERFRTMPGVARSLHPTHSVAAIGPQTHALIDGHERALTPCGEGTPYARLIEAGGQILFIGATLDQNTVYHTLEAQAAVPYLMRPDSETFAMTADGRTRDVSFRRHARGPDRRFAATAELLEAKGILRRGRVAASTALLVEAAPMAELVLGLLRKDPNYLVA